MAKGKSFNYDNTKINIILIIINEHLKVKASYSPIHYTIKLLQLTAKEL